MACGACGAAGPPRIHRDVRDYVTGDSFELVQCRSCGFATTEPVPASLDRYYPPRYRGFNAVAAFVLRRLYARRADAWLARLPPRGFALDVGSGPGWMIGALRARGWRAIGTERSADAAARTRASTGAPMFVGDLDALREGPILDLVVMFHVLEHLADPFATLRGVAARLGPGGVLVLGLPNLASWQARIAGRHWMHLDVPRHLCHFTPTAIERALDTAGFRICSIDYRSIEHDPLGWVQSALDGLGFEQGLLLKRLIGMRERRSGALATVAALLLAAPLGAAAVVLALASWPARAGAVMQVWAVRRDDSAG
jgi:SAM-dependent methyltransferase